MAGLREPSAHRRRQARAAGLVAVSRPLVAAVAFAAGSVTLCALAPAVWDGLGEYMTHTLDRAGGLAQVRWARPPTLDVGANLSHSNLPGLWSMAVSIALVAGLAGWLCGCLQGGFLWVLRALKPSLRRARGRSPWRTGPLSAIIGGVRMVLTSACLAAATVWLLVAHGPAPGALVGATGEGLVATIGEFVRASLLISALVLGAFAALDLCWRRYVHRRSLMMTEDDSRRERRELLGHPATRSARARWRRRAAVTPLRVLVTIDDAAVVLAYHRDVRDCPWVVQRARGQDALVLRADVRARGVPVVAASARDRSLLELPPGTFVPRALHARAAALMAAAAAVAPSPQRRAD